MICKTLLDHGIWKIVITWHVKKSFKKLTKKSMASIPIYRGNKVKWKKDQTHQMIFLISVRMK